MAIKIRPDGLYEIIHAPNSNVFYGFDWTAEVTPNAVVTSNWTITPTLTLTDGSVVGNITSIKVNEGDDGRLYYLTNTITTNNSEDSRTIVLVCRPKGAC